jgi:hypothetical protein
MFKKISVAFLFCLASTIANAQQFEVQRTLQCSTLDALIKVLEKFGETPIWSGKNSAGLVTIITVNPTTKTWTYSMSDGKQACILDSGDGYNIEKQSRQSESVPKQKQNQKLVDIQHK